MSSFAEHVFNTYDSFKEPALFHRRFKHQNILPLTEKKRKAGFDVSLAGKSYEGREIFLIKCGTGPNKLLLWSQMHGNEPTATQAIFDVLNFLEKPGELEKERDFILEQCSLFFIPAVNPDGTERFTRRNAQGIDINRDAIKLEAPESKILMSVRDKIQPDFAFNLHDQDIWYAAGNSGKPASISFLAPSFNIQKEIDKKRLRSMQLIVSLNKMLQQFIPGQIAKYDDGFMPTAFGDTVQMKGTSTVLIESGGQYNDSEKQFLRKLNTLLLLHAFKVISESSYKNESEEAYAAIPFNNKNRMFDFLLRNCIIQGMQGDYSADIGIRSVSETEKDRYEINDIGDLQYFFAYEEKNAEAKQIMPVNIGDDAAFLIHSFFECR